MEEKEKHFFEDMERVKQDGRDEREMLMKEINTLRDKLEAIELEN